MTIQEWIHDVIDGVGGFHDLEKYELPIFHVSRDEALAAFVLRCLGNVECEGSEMVLEAILDHRENAQEYGGEP